MRSGVGAICVGSRFTCLVLLDFFLLDECLDFDEDGELDCGVSAGVYFAVRRPACDLPSKRLVVALVCFTVELERCLELDCVP